MSWFCPGLKDRRWRSFSVSLFRLGSLVERRQRQLRSKTDGTHESSSGLLALTEDRLGERTAGQV